MNTADREALAVRREADERTEESVRKHLRIRCYGCDTVNGCTCLPQGEAPDATYACEEFYPCEAD